MQRPFHLEDRATRSEAGSTRQQNGCEVCQAGGDEATRCYHQQVNRLNSRLTEPLRRHGNWQGLSPGQVLTGWLAYILSEGDHRLNQAQDWAACRLAVLGSALGGAVRALDFSDDRLASGLDLLRDETAWGAFEAALNQRTLRVYDLQRQRVRLDTTSASGYWAVTADGLFQFGHSKDQQPDLAPVKVMLATLDRWACRR